MSKPFLVFLGAILVVAGVFLVTKEHRDRIIDDVRRTSVALAAANNEVHFRQEYESCPPENPSVYAEWTRRLADAKALSAQADETLGADDPNAKLLSDSISNQKVAFSRRQLACLKEQGKVLDQLRAARERAARSAARRYACVSDAECGTPAK